MKILVILFTLFYTCNCNVRICVPGGHYCNEVNSIQKIIDYGITCVPARDRFDCIEQLAAKTVDTTVVSNQELYLGHLMFPNEIYVIGETRSEKDKTNDHRYEGVAVIRKSTIKNINDLKGSKSCHTGYWRTAGWKIPTNRLREMEQIKRIANPEVTSVEQDIIEVSSYFGSACATGKWAPDDDTDQKLKAKYPNMCKLCKNDCSSSDPYTGYSGALDCLLNGADVGWSKYSEVYNYFIDKQDDVIGEYGLLCPDNRILDIINPNNQDVTNCAWAGRPWNAWLMHSSNTNFDIIGKALDRIMKFATMSGNVYPWTKEILNVKESSIIKDIPSTKIIDYLNKANFHITFENIFLGQKPIELCVDTPDAEDKCNALSMVMKAARIHPLLKCGLPESGEKCVMNVANNNNIITTVDGGDAYHAHKTLDTLVVAAETYGATNASYYAVAVVRKSSRIKTLEDLKGKTSCHTGIGKTSGWKMPVATLLEKGLLNNGECDWAKQVGTFFSKSCVPGAKEPKYDPNGSNPESLCALCIGEEHTGIVTLNSKSHNVCSRSDKERYYGYSGAFRCLVEGQDVAFVKHTTVFENTDEKGDKSWTRGLKSTDFILLCPDGSTAPVTDFKNCNLERVPAHQVIIGGESTDVMRENARIMLARVSTSVSNNTFKMFGEYKGKKDLIFKDSATDIIALPTDELHTAIQDGYNRKLDELDNCGAVQSPTTSGSNPTKPPYMPMNLISTFFMFVGSFF